MRDGPGCGDTPDLNCCFSDGQGISTLISLLRTLSVPLGKDLGNALYLTVLEEKATGGGRGGRRSGPTKS